MRTIRALGMAIASALALVAGAGNSAAQTYTCPTLGTYYQGSTSGGGIIQEFSAGGPSLQFKPAWAVAFAFAPGKGLYITGAYYTKNWNNTSNLVNDPWKRVLWDARLSEMFVPYHNGLDRFLDLSMGFDLVDAVPEDAGPCGRILSAKNDLGVLQSKVVNQLNNSELAWKHSTSAPPYSLVRYREEMMLWSTVGAGNYNYVIKYGFRDDGTITLRVGATGSNLPDLPLVAHMHDGLWRIDMDLNGSSSDSAYWMTHVESGEEAIDTMPPFNGGFEGSEIWGDERQFNHLLVQDPTTNSRGNKISYEFMPVRMGRAVHAEAFSKADFWVTKYDPNEMYYPFIAEGCPSPTCSPAVPAYVTGQGPSNIGYIFGPSGVSIMNTDIVAWHMSSMHHEPRDEDGSACGFLCWDGAALIMWSGLDIRPRNLWDQTPLYPNQ